MKTKIFIFILTFGLYINAFGQKPTMRLTFTAENNAQYVPLDSILIENLTQGADTTLYAPYTILIIDYATGIGESGAGDENTLSVSQNYANPFKDKTEFNLYLPEKENIKITVRDIIGRELVHYENILNQGNHSFAFYAGNETYYLLTVSGKQTSQTIKMLNAGNTKTNGEKCKLVYTGNKGDVSGFKSQQVINNFGFSLGDELKYSAYTDVEETEIIDSPKGSQIYTFQFDGWTPCSGPGTVTDIDGNIYNTVQIGDQCWMKENLKTTTYQNSAIIPHVTDDNAWSNLSTGAYVWYENDISWKDKYGALYNWFATVDPNCLCPAGWHMPTNDEWTELTDYIGGTDPPPHGNKLKSCRQVNSPLGGVCNTREQPRWNENSTQYGTDDYGFSGLPGGYCDANGLFGSHGYYGNWWSSTEGLSNSALSLTLTYDFDYIDVYSVYKRGGFSVRCLRD
jgi:uncharacterized protein (TIGR02145 family)